MAEGGKKLSEDEIYEALKSFNVPFQKNELKLPTREFIVRVFECFLKDLQIDVNSHEWRMWEATDHFEEDEIYEDPQRLILLAMIVNHITYPCRLDITVKDIVEPKPKRTKKILNYILVFWNYYVQKYVSFHKTQESFEDEKRKVEDLILENQSLDEKCNELSNILKNMQPSKEELLNAVIAKEEKMNKVEQQKEELMTEYTLLKTKVANIGNQIGATEVSIVTAKERLEELNQLIISSPDRRNTEIQRLRDRIKSEDMKIKEKEAKIKDIEKYLQQQENSLKEDEKALSILNNIIEEVGSLGKTVQCIVTGQAKLDDEEEKLKKVLFDLQQKEEWMDHHNQKSLKVAITTKKQSETFKLLLETQRSTEAKEKKRLELIKASVDKMQERIKSESNSIRNIYEKSKEASANSQARIAQYMTTMEETAENFKSDCEDLVQEMNKKFPDIPL